MPPRGAAGNMAWHVAETEHPIFTRNSYTVLDPCKPQHATPQHLTEQSLDAMPDVIRASGAVSCGGHTVPDKEDRHIANGVHSLVHMHSLKRSRCDLDRIFFRNLS